MIRTGTLELYVYCICILYRPLLYSILYFVFPPKIEDCVNFIEIIHPLNRLGTWFILNEENLGVKQELWS